jgi:hypothetical protein
MDGAAIGAAPGPLSTADRPPSPRQANRADRTAFHEHQLIAMMKAYPCASASELARLCGVGGVGSLLTRWRRLGRQGLIAKDKQGHWRVAEQRRQGVEADEEMSVSESADGARPSLVFNRTPWIWPIGYYVELMSNPSPFAIRKHG